MSFNLLAFAGGAATAFTEEIDKAEKEAKTYGLTKAKVLYERYAEVEKENSKLEKEARADIDRLRATYTGSAAFSDDQLVALAAKPEIRKALLDAAAKDYFDPSVLNPAQIVKLKEANPATGTLTERISKMYELPKMMEQKLNAMTPEQKQKLGFFGNIEYKAERAAMERFGVAAGVPIGQMEAALKASKEAKPETAEFNLAGLGKKPEDSAGMLDKARIAVIKARDKGDTVAEKAAQERLTYVEGVVTIEKLGKRTEQEILTDLANKYQETKDPAQRRLIASTIRERQELLQKPKRQGESDDDRLSANNLFSAAKSMLKNAQARALGAGKFDINAAGDITPKATTDSLAYETGTQTGMKAAIALMTDKNGIPISESHKYALAAINVEFDPKGKAFIPALESRTPPPAAKPAAPAALPQPAAAKPAAVDIATERSKALVAIEKIKKEPVENAVKQNSEAAVRKLFKEKTGQDL